jgi:hypothetical protein
VRHAVLLGIVIAVSQLMEAYRPRRQGHCVKLLIGNNTYDSGANPVNELLHEALKADACHPGAGTAAQPRWAASRGSLL